MKKTLKQTVNKLMTSNGRLTNEENKLMNKLKIDGSSLGPIVVLLSSITQDEGKMIEGIGEKLGRNVIQLVHG